MHNIINKNFDRLALLYKISQNSKIIPALSQHQQILPDYEDIIRHYKLQIAFSPCVKSVQIRSYFWSVFSRIRTEHGEIRRYGSESENTDQK